MTTNECVGCLRGIPIHEQFSKKPPFNTAFHIDEEDDGSLSYMICANVDPYAVEELSKPEIFKRCFKCLKKDETLKKTGKSIYSREGLLGFFCKTCAEERDTCIICRRYVKQLKMMGVPLIDENGKPFCFVCRKCTETLEIHNVSKGWSEMWEYTFSRSYGQRVRACFLYAQCNKFLSKIDKNSVLRGEFEEEFIEQLKIQSQNEETWSI